jgi:hypothetical protein
MRSQIIIRLILFVILSFCIFSGVSWAEDPGVADTVRLASISGEIGDTVSVPVFLYNDEELVSVVIPLLLDGYSGWLRFDSVSYVDSRLSDPAVLDDRQVYVFGTDTYTVDSLLLSFSVSSGDNLPIGTGKLCDLWFTLHFGGEVSVDILSDSPQGGLSLTDASKGSFTPQFLSGLIDISCDYLVGDVNQDDYLNVADIITLHKIYFYDEPLSGYPILDRRGRGDLNCDRRLDMRDLVRLVDWLWFDGPYPCTCGTVNPPSYDDPGLPDTVWVQSETLIVGIPSPICIGVINDEPLPGMALSLEIDGNALLQVDWERRPFYTERIDSAYLMFIDGEHADGVNPEFYYFYAWQYDPALSISLPPGRGAVCRPVFIPQSAGTATFNLVPWVNESQSMLVTEDYAAILPAFHGGNITVLAYLVGDTNHDGMINIADVVYLGNYLFAGGSEPAPYESGDANCDGEVNLGDVVYLLNYLFIGGPPPCSPSTGVLLNYDGCKEFQKGSVIDTSTPPDQDCMEYQYDGESILSLKHVNAGFNCCPEIAANITIEDNIITIEEIEISGECFCLCLFDVDYEISNLPPGEYTIKVNEVYLEEADEILEFTVDLTSSPSGTHCVYRDHYPWGIQ